MSWFFRKSLFGRSNVSVPQGLRCGATAHSSCCRGEISQKPGGRCAHGQGLERASWLAEADTCGRDSGPTCREQQACSELDPWPCALLTSPPQPQFPIAAPESCFEPLGSLLASLPLTLQQASRLRWGSKMTRSGRMVSPSCTESGPLSQTLPPHCAPTRSWSSRVPHLTCHPSLSPGSEIPQPPRSASSRGAAMG